MFGWFRSSSDCPIDAEDRAAIDRQWERLAGLFGLERMRRAEVILPLARFFPDPYDGSRDSLERMLDRLCGYMDAPRERVAVGFCDEPGAEHASLARRRAILPFRVLVAHESIDDPLAVAGTMARDLAMLRLFEDGRVSAAAEDLLELAELLAVHLGLGVIAANSNVRERQWTDPAMHKSYYRGTCRGGLNLREYGYALALFARDRGEDGSAWSRLLRPDVKDAFRQTQRFLRAEQERRRNGTAEPGTRGGFSDARA
jgi:hypothetical protein